MLDRVAHGLPWRTASTPRQSTRSLNLVRNAGLALLGTAVVAAAAHVAIPLPFTPVPLTLQPLAVLLVGLLFGPVLGFSTLCLYLLEGLAGLPVFQPLGLGGAAQLLGPTGGFLLAYPVVAAIAGGGFRAFTSRSRFFAATLAGGLATVVLFACGAAQLDMLAHLGVRATLLAAVVPFLPGECVKVLAAAGIASAWVQRSR